MRFGSAWLAVALAASIAPAHAQRYLFRADAFALTDTSAIQQAFHAVATSRSAIASNYQRAAVEVNFKFSINGFDNEHPPGSDHMIYLRRYRGATLTVRAVATGATRMPCSSGSRPARTGSPSLTLPHIET